MGKPSGLLLRLQREFEIRTRRLIRFYIQQHNDISMIALNRAFGFGPDRLKKYNDTLKELWPVFSDIRWEDGQQDKDEVYSKGVLDREMKKICGQYFAPWEQRYGGGKHDG